MSILDGCKKEVVANFQGARPALDPSSLAPDEAALAFNCTFENPLRVQPREGFASSGINYATGRKFNGVRFWEQGQTSGTQIRTQLYLRDNTTVTVRQMDVLPPTETDILTGLVDTSIPIFAPSGQRLSAAILSAAGGGSHPGYVWDGNLAHQMDQAFQRPMLTTEVSIALSQPGAGVISTGPHSVGLLFQTRTGYWTRPGPAATNLQNTGPNNNLTPAIISAPDSIHNLQVVITPTGTWPAWITNLQLILTTAVNNFQYYLVPGTITPVTPGSATPITITISVADNQLKAIGSQGAGTLADDYFGLLSMDAGNNPPFFPKFVIRWADRMVWVGNYGGVDSFFPSDPNNHQWISPDQHLKQLPGGLPISTAFVLRNILYVCSPAGGIWGFIDNGGRPVTFPKAVEIDSQIAVVSPQGVTSDSSGNSYALIGAVQGLYVFTGLGMPDLPVSYNAKTDWDQIDWANAFTTFQVKDHVNQHIFVARGTLTNGKVYIFTFNYRAGKTPDKVQYSAWTIPSYPVGPIELVMTKAGSIGWTLWVFSGTNIGTPTITLFQSARWTVGAPLTGITYHDLDPAGNSLGIDWRYNMGPMPKDNMAVLNHIALMLRAAAAQSNGANLFVTVASLDGGKTVTPVGSPFPLAQIQDTKILIPYDFQDEVAMYRFSNGQQVDNAPVISLLEHYYNLFALHS